MQIKATMKCYFMPIKLAQIKDVLGHYQVLEGKYIRLLRV